MSARDEIPLRVPPHSTEAEQSLLGALLRDNAAFDDVAGMVTEAAFYGHENRLIFGGIFELLTACKPADVVTVFARLESQGRADDCGGLAYLNALAESVPSAKNARRYAEVVADRALKRNVIAAADDAATLAWRGDMPATEILDRAGSMFDRLTRVGQRSLPKAIGDLMAGAIDRYQELAAGDRVSGVPTGFRQLDRLLAPGLKPGKVYGIAARPSVGKSSTARSIGINVATAGKTVLILSQEMPQEEQADCVVAEMARIDSTHLQTGALTDEDWSRLPDAIDRAARLPLLFDEQGSLTIGDIRAKARGVKNLGLLIVDYLQLCSSTLKGKSTNDEIAEISKGLKSLALEMRLPIVVLSQLNRDIEKRGDKEPQLSDLRDSGAIEQDLDVAILLWTVDGAEADVRRVGFKVAKHRGGAKGRFCMRFDAPIYRWADSDWPQEPTRRAL